MCLGIPGRIIRPTQTGDLLPMARVDLAGIEREVCLAYVPQAGEGDYVIIHAGFAISQITEQQARETLTLLTQIGILGPASG